MASKKNDLVKLPCFYIDDRTLYMQVELVEYKSLPVFFTCVDNRGVRYLATCTDAEDLTYVVIRVDIDVLRSLITGEISMREPFENSNEFWEVKAGNTPEEDVVVWKDSSELPLNDLPYKGSRYFSTLYDTFMGKDTQKLLEELGVEDSRPENDESCDGLLDLLENSADKDWDILISEYFSDKR